jgi:hypothetical protein
MPISVGWSIQLLRIPVLPRASLRGLRIGASTIAIIVLLRKDWLGGISDGVAWLVFLQVERRLPPLGKEQED